MIIYLNTFTFPNEGMEFDFLLGIRRTCYDSFYPFKILSKHDLERVDFEQITIFYGGNGSGKSTALNVIAEKRKSIAILSIINLIFMETMSVCVRWRL